MCVYLSLLVIRRISCLFYEKKVVLWSKSKNHCILNLIHKAEDKNMTKIKGVKAAPLFFGVLTCMVFNTYYIC